MSVFEELPKINLVTIGHKDHGKSTLIGRLLHDAGAIKGDKLRELKRTSKRLGKKKIEFAFILDSFQEEREGGLTIDVRHTPFQSKKYVYTIIDCPGHKEFIKNMITGASNADAAMLLLSAKKEEGIQEQTQEHAWLTKVLGISQMVVVVSKMDTVGYERERFEVISRDFKRILKSIGYEIENIPFVPVSGIQGDNVFIKTEKMRWYEGPTLIKALDDTIVPSEPPINRPLRIPLQDVYSSDEGTFLMGRVETGVIKVGDQVVIEPSGNKGEVNSIQILGKSRLMARPGDNIAFKVEGNIKNVKRGDVCGNQNAPPIMPKEFTAQIIILQQTAIRKGNTPIFRCGTASVACTIIEILKKTDPETGIAIIDRPDSIEEGEAGVIKVIPTEPMVMEKGSEIPQLGRFVIRDKGMTIAAGIVLQIKKH